MVGSVEPQTPHAESVPAHPPLESLAVQPLVNRDYESRPALFYERLRAEYGSRRARGRPRGAGVARDRLSQTLDILRDARGVWSKRLDSWRARREGRVPADWPLLPAFEVESSVFRDGAELTRLRGAWSEGLRPFQDRSRPQAKELERSVRRYADELITALSEGGGRTGWADLSAQYARPLPLMILGRLLGAEPGRGDEMIMDIWRMLDAGPDAAEAAQRVTAEVAAVCAAKTTSPGEDLPSYMLAAVPDLTVEELTREMVMSIGLIGDYTGTLVCNTIAEVIAGEAGVRDSVSAGMLSEAVNRAAITSPPMANLTFRWPKTDVRVGRFLIAAGDPVMLSPAAAHLDSAFTGSMAPDSIYSSRRAPGRRTARVPRPRARHDHHHDRGGAAVRPVLRAPARTARRPASVAVVAHDAGPAGAPGQLRAGRGPAAAVRRHGAASRSGAETTPETDSAAPEPGSLVRRILRMIRLAQS